MPGYTNQIADLRVSLESANQSVITTRNELTNAITSMRAVYNAAQKVYLFAQGLPEVPDLEPAGVKAFLNGELSHTLNTPVMADHVLLFMGRIAQGLSDMNTELVGVGTEIVKSEPARIHTQDVQTKHIPSPLIRAEGLLDKLLSELQPKSGQSIIDRGEALIEASRLALRDDPPLPDSAATPNRDKTKNLGSVTGINHPVPRAETPDSGFVSSSAQSTPDTARAASTGHPAPKPPSTGDKPKATKATSKAMTPGSTTAPRRH